MNENSTCYFFQFGRKVAKHFRASYMYGSRFENKVELCIARIVIRVIWKFWKCSNCTVQSTTS